jgi:hypothetical protein
MKHVKLFEGFLNESAGPDNKKIDDLIKGDPAALDPIISNDNLNDAMFDLQKMISQTDGGVCGMYWSDFDDDDKEWENSNPSQRMEHVKKYLELEKSLSI